MAGPQWVLLERQKLGTSHRHWNIRHGSARGHLKGKAMNGAGNKNSLAKGVFTMDLLSVEQALSWHYVWPKTLGNIGANSKSGRH